MVMNRRRSFKETMINFIKECVLISQNCYAKVFLSLVLKSTLETTEVHIWKLAASKFRSRPVYEPYERSAER